MAILVFSENGKFVSKPTLESVRTDLDCVDQTAVVTSVLTEAQSNTDGVWPSTIALRVEQGGSIHPDSTFHTHGGLPYAEPEWFGAVGNGVVDDSDAIQAAIDAVLMDKGVAFTPGSGVVKLNAKKYRITKTLNIISEIHFIGAGIGNTWIRFEATTINTYAIAMGPVVDGTNVIGGELCGFSLICNDGAAWGSGILMQTATTGSAMTRVRVHDIFMFNFSIGLALASVIYQCEFSDISMTGVASGVGVKQYGIFSMDGKSLYNNFRNIDITGVGDGAYAYYVAAPFSRMSNLSSDGCCLFGGAGLDINGVQIETIMATTPPEASAITLNQMAELRNVAFVQVHNDKCPIGITSQGNVNIHNVRFVRGVYPEGHPNAGQIDPDSQPHTPVVYAAGSKGTLTSVMMTDCVTKLADADLYGVIPTACSDILTNGEWYATGTWTPNYAVSTLEWSTAPTTVYATWTRNGRQITVSLYCVGGVFADYKVIGGLPFPCSDTSVGTAVMNASSDVTKKSSGSIAISSSHISGISAQTLTGVYWQLTGTYFID